MPECMGQLKSANNCSRFGWDRGRPARNEREARKPVEGDSPMNCAPAAHFRGDARGPGQSLERLFAKAAVGSLLFGGDLTLNLDLAGCARIADNFHRHAPNERLNPAGSGVVFAAIEERELYTKFRKAGMKGVEGNS